MSMSNLLAGSQAKVGEGAEVKAGEKARRGSRVQGKAVAAAGKGSWQGCCDPTQKARETSSYLCPKGGGSKQAGLQAQAR